MKKKTNVKHCEGNNDVSKHSKSLNSDDKQGFEEEKETQTSSLKPTVITMILNDHRNSSLAFVYVLSHLQVVDARRKNKKKPVSFS
ncbi:CLUMA_CG004685, isoform A [Clunio marinus]|uniref:CLUMA_CG004685, isoform A n=1 Tax=Clunio marinus TaxID=568069 RepID=A0A1J1HSL8_9DIPT|nr:CLUMA_CG004685, isoform A [Clunio marinus]